MPRSKANPPDPDLRPVDPAALVAMLNERFGLTLDDTDARWLADLEARVRRDRDELVRAAKSLDVLLSAVERKARTAASARQ